MELFHTVLSQQEMEGLLGELVEAKQKMNNRTVLQMNGDCMLKIAMVADPLMAAQVLSHRDKNHSINHYTLLTVMSL